jgi:regulator of protease activity HflC (stomatin/prohibitin superfamily)
VEDIVRSTVPKMELDSTFEAKEEIAHAIRDSLQHIMKDYGYQIIQSLVVDIKVRAQGGTAAALCLWPEPVCVSPVA